MTTSEVLRTARAKIEKPENWTQGAWARDADQHDMMPQMAGACSFCAMGAVQFITGESEAFYVSMQALKRSLETAHVSVLAFNDTHTHAEVLALFDRAIEAEEKEGR